MDFGKFETLDTTRERKGGYTVVKEQNYDGLKYRKTTKKQKGKDGKETEIVEGRFFVSKVKWDALGLATNGLKPFTAPDGSLVIATVAVADAALMREPKKTKEGQPGKKASSFTSPKLEAALENLKVIDTTKMGENQYIDLTSVAKGVTIKGINCIEVFQFSVGAPKAKEVKASVATENAQVDQPEVAKVEVATDDDWK